MIDQSGQLQQSSHRKSVAPTRISRPFNRERLADDRPIRIVATSSVPDSRPLLPDLVDPSTANGWRMIDQPGQSQQSSYRQSSTSARLSRPFNRERLADDRPTRTVVTVKAPEVGLLPPELVDPSTANGWRMIGQSG